MITFWSALRGGQQVVDTFNRTQNRIQVDFQQIPSGAQGGYAKLSNAAHAGQAGGLWFDIAGLPLIVAFMVLHRFWRSGLTTGAIR